MAPKWNILEKYFHFIKEKWLHIKKNHFFLFSTDDPFGSAFF